MFKIHHVLFGAGIDIRKKESNDAGVLGSFLSHPSCLGKILPGISGNGYQ